MDFLEFALSGKRSVPVLQVFCRLTEVSELRENRKKPRYPCP